MRKLTLKQSKIRDCTFRSMGERDTAFGLEADRQSGKIKKWEFEKHILLVVKGRTVCEIWPDFLIEYHNGRIGVLEVKGGQFFKTREWSLKRKLFEALYPYIEYRVKDTFFKNQRAKLKNWKSFKKNWVPKTIEMGP